MMRVKIPMDRRGTVVTVLKMDRMHREILAPVIEQLEDVALVEDDHAVFQLTKEECEMAAYAVSTFGGTIDGKLCLHFSEAEPVDDGPKWGP